MPSGPKISAAAKSRHGLPLARETMVASST
jgi:hypothetical protein